MAEENTTQQAISSLTYPTIDELRAPTPTTTTPQTPKEDLVYYQISEDPGAPLIEFRKDQSPEEIEQYLQSTICLAKDTYILLDFLQKIEYLLKK